MLGWIPFGRLGKIRLLDRERGLLLQLAEGEAARLAFQSVQIGIEKLDDGILDPRCRNGNRATTPLKSDG
jgi:hypothetical protein